MASATIDGSYVHVHASFTESPACKRVLGGRWYKKGQYWKYPYEALPYLLKELPDIKLSREAEELYHELKAEADATNALIEGIREPREHPFLLEHQRKCRDIAYLQRKWAFYCDTGTGKTILAYAIMKDKLFMGHRFLVLSPRSIIKTAWMEDHLGFFPELRVLPISTNMKVGDYREIAARWGCTEKVLKLRKDNLILKLGDLADIIVTNPEMFKNRTWLQEWEHDGIVVDESSILRNMKTETTATVIKHADHLKFAYLLSGKPAPNSELEYFPQMRVVNPALFGGSFYAFRSRFFDQADYFGHNFSMKDAKREEFAKRLAEGCVFISKKDCLDLPPELPPVLRMVPLSAKARDYYRDMERDKILEYGSSTIAVQTKLAALMKLRQITSGFIINTEVGTTAPLHSAKLDELKAVVTELGDNNAVIWINFKSEVAEISDMLASMGKTFVTAYSGTKNTDASIEAFKNNTAQFIIAHPKTLKYGVTFTGSSMTRNCTYAIYYSMSYSYEDYYQSHDRIYRKGQTESCTYIYLLVENSIDTAIYDAIVNKGDAALIVENLVKGHMLPRGV